MRSGAEVAAIAATIGLALPACATTQTRATYAYVRVDFAAHVCPASGDVRITWLERRQVALGDTLRVAYWRSAEGCGWTALIYTVRARAEMQNVFVPRDLLPRVHDDRREQL